MNNNQNTIKCSLVYVGNKFIETCEDNKEICKNTNDNMVECNGYNENTSYAFLSNIDNYNNNNSEVNNVLKNSLSNNKSHLSDEMTLVKNYENSETISPELSGIPEPYSNDTNIYSEDLANITNSNTNSNTNINQTDKMNSFWTSNKFFLIIIVLLILFIIGTSIYYYNNDTANLETFEGGCGCNNSSILSTAYNY